MGLVLLSFVGLIGYLACREDRDFERHGEWSRARHDIERLVVESHRWSESHDGNCPTIADLVAAGQLPPNTAQVDSWGTPYRLMCPAHDFSAMTAGEDRTWATADDLRITFAEFQAEERKREARSAQSADGGGGGR